MAGLLLTPPDIYAGQIVRIANWTGAVSAPTDGFLSNGALVDPTTVKLTVRDGTGTTTQYTYSGGQVTRDALGLYHLDIDTTGKPGLWEFAWSCTGPQIYEPGSFNVESAPL